MNDNETILCAVDSHAGIYSFQELLSRYEVLGIDDDTREYVEAGPNGQCRIAAYPGEYYAESCEEVENDGYVLIDGVRWTIHSDGDLFLVHPDHIFEDSY